MTKTTKTGLQKAIDAAGDVAALARLIDLNRATVHRWTQVPAHWIIRIEHATGVPREELRPDIFLAPRPKRVTGGPLS